MLSSITESLPSRINIEGLNKMILGYLRAGGDIEAVNYKQVAERCGISHIIVSLNNKFFADAGFIIQESPGNYRLTKNGKQYAQNIDWGRLDDARKPLQKIINEYSLSRKTLDYVKINQSVSKDDLVSQIALIAGVKKTSGNKRGINAFIDLISLSGLLTDEAGTITPTDIKKYEDVDIQKVVPLPKLETTPVEPEVTFPINITINISEETTVEKFKEYLQVLKDVFSKSRDEAQE